MTEKIPPLKCPQCSSFRVYRNVAKSILCEDCGKKTTVGGKVHQGYPNRAHRYPGGIDAATKSDIKLDKI